MNKHPAPLVVAIEKGDDQKEQSANEARAKAGIDDQPTVEHLKNVGRRHIVEKKHRQQAFKANVVGNFQKVCIPQPYARERVAQHNEQKNRNDGVGGKQ